MSKEWQELEDQYKDTEKIRKLTKQIISNGQNLAFEEFYKANSIKKLKKFIKK